MSRTDKELDVAQEVIESLINYCKRHKKKSLNICEMKATIVTLELEKMIK